MCVCVCVCVCMCTIHMGFFGGSMVKNWPVLMGDMSLIPGSGRNPGKGNGKSPQYFYLGNPMDRGAWWAPVHGVARVRYNLRD